MAGNICDAPTQRNRERPIGVQYSPQNRYVVIRSETKKQSNGAAIYGSTAKKLGETQWSNRSIL